MNLGITTIIIIGNTCCNIGRFLPKSIVIKRNVYINYATITKGERWCLEYQKNENRVVKTQQMCSILINVLNQEQTLHDTRSSYDMMMIRTKGKT